MTTGATSKATTITVTLLVAAVGLVALPVTAKSPTLAPEPSSRMAPGPRTAAPKPSMMAPAPGTYAPGPSLDCGSYLVNVSDCLSFVEPGSNLTKPEEPCCPEVAGLLESQPICLCQFLGNPGKVGVPVDINKALKLPSVCNVSAPSPTLCAAFGIPVSAPAGKPPSPPAGGEGTSTPANPASGNRSNNYGGRSIEASHLCFLAGLATFVSISFF